jgi:hypothetical protein
MSPEEMEKEKAENKEAMWEMVYLIIAVLFLLMMVSAFMVYTTYPVLD